jgi:hypothetical protein
VDEKGSSVGIEARCAHPGCDRSATEVAVVDSAWEDAATGSALMVCGMHADTYVPVASIEVGAGDDAMRRVRRRDASA